MSGDLISRGETLKAIYDYIEKHRNDEEISWIGYDWLLKEDAVIDIINGRPVAYDADRVVEQLELLSENEEYNALNTYEEKAAYNTAYIKAIEAVKAGGANE